MLRHLAGFRALTAVFLSVRAFYQPEDREAELDALARDLATHNSQLRFIGISLTDGRSMRDDEPLWDEERLGARWWTVGRQEDEYGLWGLKSVDVVPTEVGMKVREYMYGADFDSAGWEERLSAFV